MAKDGTNRGGRRVGSGRKRDSLVEKLEKGKPANVMQFPSAPTFEGMGAPLDEMAAPLDDLTRSDYFLPDMPKPNAYLSAAQHDGKPFGADVIYEEVVKWLRDRHCADFINPRLIEAYANAFARFVQCSEAVSQYGLIGKHPTTGIPIKSPFVDMELHYLKQANQQWYEIFQIVKENSLTAFDGNPQEDMMERLLATRHG